MKILYDYQIFKKKYGGVSRYFVELNKNISLLKDKNLKLKIISPFYKNNYLKNNRSFLNFKGLYLNDFKRSEKVCNLMNLFLSPVFLRYYNPNLIHATYYSLLQYDKLKAKKIITVHDMIHELFPKEFLNDNITKLKREAVQKADHIICVSHNTQKDLIKIFNIDINKTSVIHHGLNQLDYKNQRNKIFDRPYILFVGKRKGYKNFLKLIEVFALTKIYNSFDLVVFGGENFSKQELIKINDLKIPKKTIKFIYGDDTLLAYCYKNANLFVYPSLYEGFGMPLLEAMSFGCAVACSNTSSLPEVVDDAAVLFDPNSVESMSENIVLALYDNKLRTSLISKGYKQSKKFNWKRCALETLNVYKSLI